MIAGNIIVRIGADVTGISEGFKKAQEVLEKGSKKLKSAGSVLTKGITAPMGAAVAGIAALRNSTAEYRADMSKFEQNVKSSGTSLGKMKDELFKLTAITGEGDAAIEALSNLMATGFDDTEMERALKALSGAVIKFPDTLKIEGLADGLQETLATGKAVGTFAELIERMGGNVEEFDIQMANATTSAEKQQVALDWLAKSGLSDVTTEYENTNKAALDASKAQQEFQDKVADLAKAFDPLITALLPVLQEHIIPAVVTLTEWVGEMAEKFSKLKPQTQENIVKFAGFAFVLGPVLSGLGGVLGVIAPLIGKLGGLKGVVGGAGGVTSLLGGAGGLGPVLLGLFNPATGAVLTIIAGIALLVFAFDDMKKAAKAARDEGSLATQALAAGTKQPGYKAPPNSAVNTDDLYGEKKTTKGTSAYNTQVGISQMNAKLDFKSSQLESYAIGTNYVPSDGLAYLHKGEAVIPADQNKGFGGGVIVNVTGNTILNDRDADRLGDTIVRRLKLAGVKV